MFEANGVTDRVELRRGHSRDVPVDERADVIVHEVVGFDPFGENILPVIEDARERMLAPGGRLIPSAMEVWCVGFEVPDVPYLDTARAAVELSELEGLFGIDFGAFRQHVTEHSEWFPRPLPPLGGTEFAPRILTEPAQLYRIDFAPGSSLAVVPRKNARLRAVHAGTLGGVVIYFRAHLDDETFLGNSPWMPQTSWGRNARSLGRLVAVQPGEEIDIACEVSTVAGVQGLRIALASR
jgi:protein arginine N-methyltransferase 1